MFESVVSANVIPPVILADGPTRVYIDNGRGLEPELEALSLEVPLVISDTSALKNYFQNSAVYTSHDPEDVYKSILIAIEMNNELKNNCKKIKIIRNNEFEDSIQRIRQLVDN